MVNRNGTLHIEYRRYNSFMPHNHQYICNPPETEKTEEKLHKKFNIFIKFN